MTDRRNKQAPDADLEAHCCHLYWPEWVLRSSCSLLAQSILEDLLPVDLLLNGSTSNQTIDYNTLSLTNTICSKQCLLLLSIKSILLWWSIHFNNTIKFIGNRTGIYSLLQAFTNYHWLGIPYHKNCNKQAWLFFFFFYHFKNCTNHIHNLRQYDSMLWSR